MRGAAWLGGITLAIAALFFAKWSIEQGFFSPVIRVATLLVLGAAALAWAEVTLRAGYQATANAVSGAGVVMLYVAFYAGHSLYHLFMLTVAFAGMSVVTLLAGVIAVRFAAQFTAIIGLAGGLATPLLLSSGADRPVAFFSYLAVLAAGYLVVAEHRRWVSVTALALVGITALELLWYATSMRPGQLGIAAVAVFVIGVLFLRHAIRSREDDSAVMHQAALAGALVPLGFAVLFVSRTSLANQWPTIALFLALADVTLIVAALTWELPIAIGAAAVATAIAMTLLGDVHRRIGVASWAVPLVAMALSVSCALLPRVAAWRDTARMRAARGTEILTGLFGLVGLLGFTWLAVEGRRLPLWAFVMLITAGLGIAIERTRSRPATGAFGGITLLLSVTVAHWVMTMATAATYVDQLTLPHLLAVAVAIVAARRDGALTPATGAEGWRTDHAATVIAVAMAWLLTLGALDRGAGASALPLFALVSLQVLLALATVAQATWAWLVPLSAASTLVFSASWHVGHFTAETAAVGVTAYTLAYLVFLAWPFAAARWLSPAWSTRPAAWVASALMGPATFPLYYDAWRDLLGTSTIGIVPVVMAGVSVTALYGISRHFAVSADAADARRRLNYLALFAAVTLGFIATAIPVQLDRQWITIGWALEGAAVWWLFGHLPHPGLKYFGVVLFLAVGARLLANPEVLHYHPRGAPILNWLLYTYGVPALCCLLGAYLLRGAERRRGGQPEHDWLATDRETPGPVVAFIGLLLMFWLINLEIADFYSVGRYVELDFSRHLARDLTRSCAWGLYALVLLGAGLWRTNRGLRLVSMGFLLLTVAKVFVYDLGQLTGLYRIMSFVALGVSLIVVSLLYQRFVRRTEVTA